MTERCCFLALGTNPPCTNIRANFINNTCATPISALMGRSHKPITADGAFGACSALVLITLIVLGGTFVAAALKSPERRAYNMASRTPTMHSSAKLNSLNA